MASRYKGRDGPSRPSRTKTPTTGARGCQRTLYSFMDPKPKVTQTPQQLSPTISSSPIAKTGIVSSTSGSNINAGEKRKKAEVIQLTSDEDDPPLKRRKLSVDPSSPTRPYQASIRERSSVARRLATGSPRYYTMPNFAATTPYSDTKTYSRGLQVSGMQSQRPREGRGGLEGQSLPVGLPAFLPGGHETNSVGVDMELDVVPCSQAQDDLPLVFHPIAPSTSASPLQPISPLPQRGSLYFPIFTPKPVRVSQQPVPSSATPSDLRESSDVYIGRDEAPHVPVFTLSSPSYLEGGLQTAHSPLPSSSFPRINTSESPSLLAHLAEENDPALPQLSKRDDRIESSQTEESFEFAFHIPPPPPLSRRPLRRRTPCVSVDGTATRNQWSGVFDALAATHKSDPAAAQSPRKRAASSPIKPVAERPSPSEEEIQKSEESEEGIVHEQSPFRPFHSPPPTKPSWSSHTPQRQPSPLRLLLSQTGNTASTSPTKRAVLPSPSEISPFLSPSRPRVVPTASKHTPSTSQEAPFINQTHLKSPTSAGSEESPSNAFGLAYVSPPTLLSHPGGSTLVSQYGPEEVGISQEALFISPTRLKSPTSAGSEESPSNAFGLAYVSPPDLLSHPGGSTPVSQHGPEEAGISQYPESLADEPLPDFLLTFGESQGMEDWIQGMQKQR